MSHSRRDFLVRAGCGTLSTAAFLTGFNRFSLLNLCAAQAQTNDEYKALVCIFMFGGNDSNNMIIPYDDYALYSAARAGSQFEIAQADLLQITPPSIGATYGLPNRTTYDVSQWKALWDAGVLAFVVNMGTLVRPITRTEYQTMPSLRPSQLFSHADQQTENMTSKVQGVTQTGWGGRIADRFHGSESFPIVTSVAGVTVFSAAQLTRPLVIPGSGALNQALQFVIGRPSVRGAVDQILNLSQADGTPTLLKTEGAITQQALSIRDQLQTDPVINTTFPNTSLGNQLKQIAKLIKTRGTLGVTRQIFFASLGGFDTHTGQNGGQGPLLTQMSNAMKAFYDETVDQGVANQITTFTLSDFTRTFKPGGGQTGTDHAWGGHMLVMGGAVRGGDFYGTFPTLVANGPDDTDSGSGARGRWIPTTSIDQYGATLALWMGVPRDEIHNLVFPNIERFATDDLGFMNP